MNAEKPPGGFPLIRSLQCARSNSRSLLSLPPRRGKRARVGRPRGNGSDGGLFLCVLPATARTAAAAAAALHRDMEVLVPRVPE